MISEETTKQLLVRTQRLVCIRNCLEFMGEFATAEVEITFNTNDPGKKIRETIAIGGGTALELLKELKTQEESRLKDLNAQAIQEAQNAEAQT